MLFSVGAAATLATGCARGTSPFFLVRQHHCLIQPTF